MKLLLLSVYLAAAALVAQAQDFDALCAVESAICGAEIEPVLGPDRGASFRITEKSGGAPTLPVLQYTPLRSPAIEIEISQKYLEETVKNLLTTRLTLGQPASTNFLVCDDKNRIDFEMGVPSSDGEYGPFRITLRDNNCRFGVGDVCHNCGLKHFYFYLYPVFRTDAQGGAYLDFYLWPNWILLTHPPGGRELPFWISVVAMKHMWNEYFVPRFGTPSGFRKPLFDLDLSGKLDLQTTVTVLKQSRELELRPNEMSILVFKEDPSGDKNGKLVLQANF